MGRLSDKIALIVGAAGGIGSATAEAFAREGAKLILLDVNESRLSAITTKLASTGVPVTSRVVDISDEAAVKRAVEEGGSSFGGLDILCNIAADLSKSTLGRDSDADILTVDREVFNRTLNVNLFGYLNTMRHAVPLMLRRGGGAIINTSSTAAIAPEPRRHAYAISKAAVDVMTRQVAACYGKRGIRCNSVIPGLVMTYEWPAEWTALHTKLNATDYPAKPVDLANVYVFLASDEARYITGETLRADGGFYCRQPGFPEQIELAERASQFSSGSAR